MGKPRTIRIVTAEDPLADTILHMTALLRLQGNEIIARNAVPILAGTLMISAAMVYAGSILGELIVAGAAEDPGEEMNLDVLVKNFRTGIALGKVIEEATIDEAGDEPAEHIGIWG